MSCFYFWSRGQQGSWRSPCLATWTHHEGRRISSSILLILHCRLLLPRVGRGRSLEAEGDEWGEGTLDCLFPTSCPQVALLGVPPSSLRSQLPLYRPGHGLSFQFQWCFSLNLSHQSMQGGNFLMSPQHLLLTCRICYNLVNQLSVFQSWLNYSDNFCSLARFWIEHFSDV